jgi:hypothetical protein
MSIFLASVFRFDHDHEMNLSISSSGSRAQILCSRAVHTPYLLGSCEKRGPEHFPSHCW